MRDPAQTELLIRVFLIAPLDPAGLFSEGGDVIKLLYIYSVLIMSCFICTASLYVRPPAVVK